MLFPELVFKYGVNHGIIKVTTQLVNKCNLYTNFLNKTNMIAQFLEYLTYEKRGSQHTTLAYQKDLEQFNDFCIQQQPDFLVEKASYQDIRAWIIHLLEKELAEKTVNRKLAAIKSFYHFLLKKEVISTNPATKLQALTTQKQPPVFVKQQDIAKVLDESLYESDFVGTRDRIVMELLYGTGIRVDELIKLKLTDIHIEEGYIKVTGKRNKQRIIPCNDTLKDFFSIYLSNRIGTSDSFIVTVKGKPAYHSLIYRIVNKYLSYCNVDKKSPHVLRHTFATHLLNEGAELNDIKELLGHSSLAATQIYTHNSLERIKKIFNQSHPKAGENE